MELKENHNQFLAYCEEARTYALGLENPLIVHHYDADGCASGSIVMDAFLRENKPFRALCIKKLDDTVINKLAEDGEKNIIFVDLGSGNARVNEFKNVVIIDHHQPLKEINVRFHVNCMLHGIDGGDELSAASTAYLVFRNRVDLGVTGAVADQQAPFVGMNRFVLEEGIKKGEVRVENDICFYGRYARPLIQFLSLSDDPYVPGISYNEQNATKLLSDLGIELKGNDAWRTYADLAPDEKKRLVNALVDILVLRGRYKAAKELIGESYVFLEHARDETYEASEFSTLLNACGRHGAHDVAVGVCLNKPGAIDEARKLLAMHKNMIRTGIEFAFAHRQDLGPFYFLDARGVINEGIIGIVCGMTLQHGAKKPMIGISSGELGTIKCSARGTKELVANGLNLGAAMHHAAAGAGGIGGGHKIAAGASIPADKLNEFLVFAAEKIRPLS